jgi:transposase InsO family protein
VLGGLRRVRRRASLNHGLEFAAEALASVAATLGIRISPAPAYTPHLKGRIERLNRTVAQDFLCTLPFFTDGPRDAADSATLSAPGEAKGACSRRARPGRVSRTGQAHQQEG